jgi:hypothetical protein
MQLQNLNHYSMGKSSRTTRTPIHQATMSDTDDADADDDSDVPVAETESLLDGQTIQLSGEVYRASEQDDE